MSTKKSLLLLMLIFLPSISDAGVFSWFNDKFEIGSFFQLRFDSQNSSTVTQRKILHIAVLKDSGWQENDIRSRLERLHSIYLQCGVELGFNVFSVSAEEKYQTLGYARDQSRGSLQYKIATHIPSQFRPLILYINKNIWSKTSSIAYANPATTQLSPSHPLSNTAFIPYDEYAMKSPADYTRYGQAPDYLVEAHELGHLFLGGSHDSERDGNFMSFSGTSNRILPDQCEEILKNIDLTKTH
ncbi:MAG TPA: hypothetical protein PL182_10825 [Pseudobdellovibrionaceae bacterium]|nr:hypothetical protein [Pseudobdellovibrionaceae bacterium]